MSLLDTVKTEISGLEADAKDLLPGLKALIESKDADIAKLTADYAALKTDADTLRADIESGTAVADLRQAIADLKALITVTTPAATAAVDTPAPGQLYTLIAGGDNTDPNYTLAGGDPTTGQPFYSHNGVEPVDTSIWQPYNA